MKLPVPAVRLRDEAAAARILWSAGMVPRDARAAIAGVRAVVRLGPFGGLPAYCAAVHGDTTAVIDDRGSLTFAEFADRTHRLADALRSEFPGRRRQPSIGIMCRNHADALVTLCAAAAVGARVVLLGADFGPRQVAVVAERERLDALVHDEEFRSAVTAFGGRSWCARYGGEAPDDALDRLVDRGDGSVPPRPAHPASLVILTSGTSGVPKGAPRAEPRTLLLTAGLLERIPLRGGMRLLLSAPVFHGWGLLVAVLTLMLGGTLVLRPRFEAATALATSNASAAAPSLRCPRCSAGSSTSATGSGARISLHYASSPAACARLEPALVRAVRISAWALHNLYGSTEGRVRQYRDAVRSRGGPETAPGAPNSAPCSGSSTTREVPCPSAWRAGSWCAPPRRQIDAYTTAPGRSGDDGFSTPATVGISTNSAGCTSAAGPTR